MVSILQNWVENLSLRYQGVLLSGIRGCDFATKEDSSKKLIRAYRGYILISFDKKPTSFIEYIDIKELKERMIFFLKDFDHYPMHYITHLLYASEIIGYKHPDKKIRKIWHWFYKSFVYLLHLRPESKIKMEKRLEATEQKFSDKSRRLLCQRR